MFPSLPESADPLTMLDARSLGKLSGNSSTHRAFQALRLVVIIMLDAHDLRVLRHVFSDTRWLMWLW